MARVSYVAAAFVLALLLIVCFVHAERDFYKILNVNRDATQKQIKKAYRELSLKFHPDKNRGNKDAENKFMEITGAYEVLSNEDKRRKYDQYGEEGLKDHSGGGGFGFNDIFSQFGFGGQRQHHSGHRQMPKAEAITIPLEVTLRDLYLGRDLYATHSKQVLCHKCHGTGADDPSDVKTCPKCKGQGFVTQIHQLAPGFMQQSQATCNQCGGKGKIVGTQCKQCHGHKVEHGESDLTLTVERGMKDGDTIVFESRGDEVPDVIPGDLVFKISTVRHEHFTRQGNNLHYTMNITLLEALNGFNREIEHLDGHHVSVNRTEVTQYGDVAQIVGEGMPIHTTPSLLGDLFVKFVVHFPTVLSDEQKALFSKALSVAVPEATNSNDAKQ